MILITQEISSAIKFVQQEYSVYTETDHTSWNQLLAKQLINVQDKACKEFLSGLKIVEPLIRDLPNLSGLSKQLKEAIGWGVIPVNGFLETEEYFNYLYNRLFPVNISLRNLNNFNFDPLPDMFHDCFGHLPLLANPIYSQFMERISLMMLVANKRQRENLSKLYWYTIEAGICYEYQQVRVYGTSQLSSFNELAYAVSDQPKVYSFNLQKIIQCKPYPYDFQQEIFAIPNFEFLSEIVEQMNWFMNN